MGKSKKNVIIVVGLILVAAGVYFYGKATSGDALNPSLFGPHRLGDTISEVKSHVDIDYYETIYGEYYDAWEGLDLYDSNIVGLEGIRFTQPLMFGFLNHELELVRYAVNHDYKKLIALFVEEYGEPVVHVSRNPREWIGAASDIVRWRYESISAVMLIRGTQANIVVVLASHAVMDEIIEEFMKHHVYDITFDEFVAQYELEDYMFDIYGMDENTQPMVEINIGNPALEKLIRGIEGSSYTETPKYESDIPGILHPRGVKFYKPDGPLYVQEVTEISALYSFQGQEEKIATLNGIEQCINLRFLALSDHEVTDISLLRSLQNLEYLNLDVDTIRDFSPLLDLPNLIEVDLIGNPPNSDNRKEVAEELRSRGVRVYYY